MNPKEQIPKPDDSLDELDMDTSPTVDDFIKELEAKEKDLHITSDLMIEVSDSDFDGDSIPEFLKQELGAVPASTSAVSPPAETVPSAGLKTRVYELEQQLAELKERNAAVKADRKDIQEKSDRRLKDFESYKYRMDRERRGAFIDQISNLASQMLPVLDNLDRALVSVENSKSKRSAEFDQFYEGIVLVNQQVNEVLLEMGVQPITTANERFDPNFHEAVSTEERDDMPNNSVSAELRRGYRIGNRVIRHSMVKVTTSPATSAVDLDPFPEETALSSPPDQEQNSTAVDLDPSPENEPVDHTPDNDLPDLDPSAAETE